MTNMSANEMVIVGCVFDEEEGADIIDRVTTDFEIIKEKNRRNLELSSEEKWICTLCIVKSVEEARSLENYLENEKPHAEVTVIVGAENLEKFSAHLREKFE